jgi:hypothetical protein
MEGVENELEEVHSRLRRPKLEGWVAKLEGWVAKLEGWVAMDG